MNWMFIFLMVVTVVFGLYTLGIGILGLARKRPFAFSARALMWVLFLAFLPNLVNSFIPLFDRWQPVDLFLLTMPFINLALMVMLVFVFWRQMTGYIVFGVYDETFRDALTATLNKLNIRFQETISKIRLVELDADLQAAVAGWMGSAQIRIKQHKQAQLIKKIAAGMNEYYSSTPVRVNNVAFVVYIILGILMLIMAAAFAFTFIF